MKKIILVVFMLVSALSFSENSMSNKEAESNYKISLGFMGGYGSSLYKVDESYTRYIPILGVEGENFYVLGSEIGYRHKLNSKLTVTGFSQLFGGVSLQGVGGAIGSTQLKNSDMEEGYKGISSRKTQTEVGVRLGYNTGFKNTILSGEVRGGQRGSTAKISALRPVIVTERLSIIPQMNFTLVDHNMVNYYFSVSEDEVNDPRNTKLDKAYNSDQLAYASGIGVTGNYQFTSEWSAFALAEMQYVADEIGNSPIVDERANYFVGVGLRYNF